MWWCTRFQSPPPLLVAARLLIAVMLMAAPMQTAFALIEGGEGVGKWSGSGNINAENQIAFENIPPGRYVVRGQPNPSTADRQTETLSVQLPGGQSAEVRLSAK